MFKAGSRLTFSEPVVKQEEQQKPSTVILVTEYWAEKAQPEKEPIEIIKSSKRVLAAFPNVGAANTFAQATMRKLESLTIHRDLVQGRYPEITNTNEELRSFARSANSHRRTTYVEYEGGLKGWDVHWSVYRTLIRAESCTFSENAEQAVVLEPLKEMEDPLEGKILETKRGVDAVV